LSTIFYFKPMPVPYVVSAQLSSALEWAAQRFAEAGLAPQAERLRHHFGLPSPKALDEHVPLQ